MATRRKGQTNKAKPSDAPASRSPADYEKVGPTSIEGVEASDLPDKGRGDVFTDPSREAGRRLPQQTGEWGSGETGLAGDPEIADSRQHGRSRGRSS
jgi:hypothetical protein